ncbi:MAG: c-type cytochrome [Thermoanaerobaculia bacterium]
MRSRTALLLAAALPLTVLCAGCNRRPQTTPEQYDAFCARCHGDHGEGVAKSLKLYPNLDFAASPMVRRDDRAAVRQRIVEGYGPMPGFARRLTPQEIERMVDFTFQLARNPKEDP